MMSAVQKNFERCLDGVIAKLRTCVSFSMYYKYIKATELQAT